MSSVAQEPASHTTDLAGLLRDCVAAEAAADGPGHHSTRDFFPFLLKLCQKNLPPSPNSRLVEDAIWTQVADNSSTRLIGQWMLQFDALADYLQRRHFGRLASASLCALGFLLGFELFAHWYEDKPIVMLVALLLLAAAFTIVFFFRSKTVQMGYLSTRAIAEVLRIRFFLEAGGAAYRPHEQVPRRYEPVFERLVAILGRIETEASQCSQSKISKEDILSGWFEGQRSYFARAAKREQARAKTWSLISSVSFGIGLAALIALAYVSWRGETGSIVIRVLLVLGPSLLGVAAVSQSYLERRGFVSNAERYLHSVEIYAVDTSDWDACLLDVGEQALQEVVDWYVASMEREVCVPK